MRGGCRRRPLRRRSRLGARARCRASCVDEKMWGLDCARFGTHGARVYLPVSMSVCGFVFASFLCLCCSVCVHLSIPRYALCRSFVSLRLSPLVLSLSSPPPPVPIVHSFLQLRRQRGLQSVVDERAVRVPAKARAREVEPRLILVWVRHRNGGRQLLCKSCIQGHTKACDTDPHLL